MKITSLSNPRVKSIVRLNRRSGRHDAGLMPVEGLREISRALQGGIGFEEVF